MSDPLADQVLFYSSPPDTTGMGIRSLDVTGLQVNIARDGIQVRWGLADLQRPAPGQSWLYRFSFHHAEEQFDVVAQMQALAEPMSTVVTDRFLITRSGDPATAALSLPISINGSFDFARRTITANVTAMNLGRRDTSRYTMTDFEAVTEQDFGNTLGVPSDHAYLPSDQVAVGIRRGC